jgi:D-3-phosphoglycerate dehydrogenase / 2-oxoglutarate reductase
VPRALVLDHAFPDIAPERAVLEAQGIEGVDGTRLDPDARLACAEEAHALLVRYSTVDAPVVARVRRCRVIGCYGVGYDQIEVRAASARGVTVVHVPDYGTEEVSDHPQAFTAAVLEFLAP